MDQKANTPYLKLEQQLGPMIKQKFPDGGHFSHAEKSQQDPYHSRCGKQQTQQE